MRRAREGWGGWVTIAHAFEVPPPLRGTWSDGAAGGLAARHDARGGGDLQAGGGILYDGPGAAAVGRAGGRIPGEESSPRRYRGMRRVAGRKHNGGGAGPATARGHARPVP